MLKKIKEWYQGKAVIYTFDEPNILPMVETEYHWSAKVARHCVGFYLRNWQWIFGIMVAILALLISLKEKGK